MSMIRGIDQEQENEYVLLKIICKLFFVILSFFLINFVFSQSAEDIKNYMEDHREGFCGMEGVGIFLFLIVFYLLPLLFINCLKGISPNRHINYKRYLPILGLIFGAIFILSILTIIFPMIATMEGPERDGLKRTVLVWLISLFVLNILISNELPSYFEEKLAKSTCCQRALGSICEWFSSRLK